jgi:hypothetical protein
MQFILVDGEKLYKKTGWIGHKRQWIWLYIV